MRLWMGGGKETMMSLNLNVAHSNIPRVLLLEIYIFLPVGLEQGPQNREKIQCTQKAEAQRGCGAATDGRKQGDGDVIGL